MNRRTLIITAALSIFLMRGVMAADTPVKILATIAVEGAFVDIEPMLPKHAGGPVKVEFAPTLLILEKLTKGETADIVILTQAAVQQLAAKGQVKAQADLVQSEVGLAVADNAPTPVMKTTEDFIAFMKATPSVAYTASGASGQHMAQVVEKLGLNDIVKPKATIVSEGFSATLLQQGKVASAVQQVSELKFGGAKNIVPFPDAIQSRLIFSAGVLSNTTHADAAAKILKVLTSSEVVAAYQRSGVTPVFK